MRKHELIIRINKALINGIRKSKEPRQGLFLSQWWDLYYQTENILKGK